MTAPTLPVTPAAEAAGAPALRILALDLSITATGVCLPDGTTSTIKTKASDGDRRLQHIANEVGLALGDSDYGDSCDLVVMEEAPPGLKGPAIKAIHMVHGAVRLRLIDFGTPYVVINPTTLKAYATGNTHADKTAMAIAALKRTGREFADDNQCDAAWLRWAALDALGHPEFPMPAAQRARLTKVTWPAVRRG